MSQHVQDGEPDADVLRPLGDRPPRLTDELLRVQPDLHPVVQEREKWRQRKGGDKNGDESELQD